MDSPSKIRINPLGYDPYLPQRVTVLTNGPLIAFGDVWDYSYENDQGDE